MSAPPNDHVLHKDFFVAPGARPKPTHARHFPKMPTAPSGFPLRRPKGVKAWGEGPLRPNEISRYRDTLGRIRAADNTAGRSATRQLESCRPILICGICCSPHLTGKCGTRPFFRWVQVQDRSPHTPGIPKNAKGPVGIPLIRGASGAGQWTQPTPEGGKSLGDGPLRPKEISKYQDTLGQIRAVDNTAGRSATRHLEGFRPILICGI